MWTVVYIAQSEKQAQRYCDLLRNEGLLVKLRPLGIGTSVNSLLNEYEVLVLEAELEEALEIISSISFK